jgi:1-hydroxycarotenoid 3,4-desaturase
LADPLRAHRAVVVGAGIGGLVSALLLARRGVEVTVLERGAAPGGKMRQVVVNAAPVDSGPTVFTMRWIFEQIFAAAGTSVDACLELTPLDVLARHAWSADERLDLHADPGRSAEAIGAFAGAAEARRFVRFCHEARRLYATLEGPYIRSEKPTLARMMRDLGPRGLAVLVGLGRFATLWRALGRHFHDPRLRQLFGRYATYCGASPWSAPATLMLVAQVEMDGVWSVRGGMHAVAQAVAGVAASCGARFRYGADCAEILVRNGRAAGVRLASGEEVQADSVVFNGDAGALAQGLLGGGVRNAAPPVAPRDRSLSALTWSMHARTSGFPLDRHNVFFPRDYAAEFRDIFANGRLPAQPTVYLCAQDRDGGEAPGMDGPERLLALVNAPAVGDLREFGAAEIGACEQTSLALLERCGLQVERSAANTVVTTPADFEHLFPGTGGALYGRATHGWTALFKRASSTSAMPGLYLTGGSVHPGPGVPMAAMSGQLAAATLLAHLDSTSRSHRVVISGGTSTRSATTANTA